MTFLRSVWLYLIIFSIAIAANQTTLHVEMVVADSENGVLDGTYNIRFAILVNTSNVTSDYFDSNECDYDKV